MMKIYNNKPGEFMTNKKGLIISVYKNESEDYYPYYVSFGEEFGQDVKDLNELGSLITTLIESESSGDKSVYLAVMHEETESLNRDIFVVFDDCSDFEFNSLFSALKRNGIETEYCPDV